MEDVLIYSKLAALPQSMRLQVADFIEFLTSKANKENLILPKNKPVFGSAKGMFVMHADFDAPLEDFKEYMY